MEKQLHLVQKCINLLTKHGKKSKAENLVKKAFFIIKQQTERSPLKVIQEGLDNIKPVFLLKKWRKRKKTLLVPVALPEISQDRIGLRWIIENARMKKKKSRSTSRFETFFANEILEAFHNKSDLVSKRNEIHKAAEANRNLLNRIKPPVVQSQL